VDRHLCRAGPEQQMAGQLRVLDDAHDDLGGALGVAGARVSAADVRGELADGRLMLVGDALDPIDAPAQCNPAMRL
jgi:hypothetical protein